MPRDRATGGQNRSAYCWSLGTGEDVREGEKRETGGKDILHSER